MGALHYYKRVKNTTDNQHEVQRDRVNLFAGNSIDRVREVEGALHDHKGVEARQDEQREGQRDEGVHAKAAQHRRHIQAQRLQQLDQIARLQVDETGL